MWVAIACVAAVVHPPSFLWFKKDFVTAGLALTMLAMGTTLSLEVYIRRQFTIRCTASNLHDMWCINKKQMQVSSLASRQIVTKDCMQIPRACPCIQSVHTVARLYLCHKVCCHNNVHTKLKWRQCLQCRTFRMLSRLLAELCWEPCYSTPSCP